MIFGETCIDRYIFGTCSRLSPEDPVPIFVDSGNIDDRPGMSKNVLKNLENLGNNIDHITHNEKIIKTRIVATGYAHYRSLLRIDKEAKVRPLSNKRLNSIRFSDYDIIVISDYNKGFLSHDTCRKICKLAFTNNKKVFVDSKKTDLSCFENAVIKINQLEKSLCNKLPKNFEIIVTLGSKGAIYKDKIIPAFNKYIADDLGQRDVCGAGDTFLAALIHKFIRSNNLKEAIEFANKCAAIVVCRFGTSQISKDDLKDL